MTWVYLPPGCCPSAPEPGDSTSALSWRVPMLAQSVTWNGKLSPSRSWSRRWKQVSWTRLLFGATLPPSTAGLGVERWIGSLEESPASPIRRPENVKEPRTTETFGPTPPESLEKSDPVSSSWRMFQESHGITTNGLNQTYEQWVTGLRKDYSRRRKSGCLKSGKGYLSWRTPEGTDGEGGVMEIRQGKDAHLKFRDQAGNRPTPTTAPEAPNANANTKNGPPSLQQAAATLWPTATASTGQYRYGGRNALDKSPSIKLDGAARVWPTATATDGGKETILYGNRTMKLSGAARLWPTTNATDGDKAPDAYARGNPSLPAAARHFPAPTVSSAKGFDGPNKAKASKIWEPYSRLARMNLKSGHNCSSKCRRLNPLFVEWLMGWPGGWTLLPTGLKDFGSLATEWSRWWRLMRSALSRRGSA